MIKLNIAKSVGMLLIVFGIVLLIKNGIDWYTLYKIEDGIKHPLSASIDDPRVQIAKGLAYVEQKEDKKAASVYLKVIEDDNTTPDLKALALRNLGNLRFRQAVAINGQSMDVRDEAEFLFNQAKDLYRASLRLNPNDWAVKHNLDRLALLLKDPKQPGEDDGVTGVIQGNIPPGRP